MNSAFLNISQHFTGHLFSRWIPSSARGIDGGPQRSTEVVLNEQSLPVAGGRLMDSSDRRGREVTFSAGENMQHFVDLGLITEIVPTPPAESAGAQSPQSGD